MTANNSSRTLKARSGSLVDGLARSVISKVNSTPHVRRNRRVEFGANVLYAAVTDGTAFDDKGTWSNLTALKLSRTDVIDHCIPAVARMLGDDWVEDRRSFVAVTSASSRLFGLCKLIGDTWDNARPDHRARSLLLTTLYREDHILGPAVVADQLRRRGHSVQLLTNTTPKALGACAGHRSFDAVLLSVSSWKTLAVVSDAVTEIKKANESTLVVLGGAILNENGFNTSITGADLTTNDIDAALDHIVCEDIDLRVAE